MDKPRLVQAEDLESFYGVWLGGMEVRLPHTKTATIEYVPKKPPGLIPKP